MSVSVKTGAGVTVQSFFRQRKSGGANFCELNVVTTVLLAEKKQDEGKNHYTNSRKKRRLGEILHLRNTPLWFLYRREKKLSCF